MPSRPARARARCGRANTRQDRAHLCCREWLGLRRQLLSRQPQTRRALCSRGGGRRAARGCETGRVECSRGDGRRHRDDVARRHHREARLQRARAAREGGAHIGLLAASDAPHLLVVVARQFSSARPGETHTCGLVRRGGARRACGRQGALRAPRRGEACSMRFPDIRNKRARAPGGLRGVAHREDAPQRRRQRSIMARWKHDVGHGCLSCQRVTPASIGCVSR